MAIAKQTLAAIHAYGGYIFSLFVAVHLAHHAYGALGGGFKWHVAFQDEMMNALLRWGRDGPAAPPAVAAAAVSNDTAASTAPLVAVRGTRLPFGLGTLEVLLILLPCAAVWFSGVALAQRVWRAYVVIVVKKWARAFGGNGSRGPVGSGGPSTTTAPPTTTTGRNYYADLKCVQVLSGVALAVFLFCHIGATLLAKLWRFHLNIYGAAAHLHSSVPLERLIFAAFYALGVVALWVHLAAVTVLKYFSSAPPATTQGSGAGGLKAVANTTTTTPTAAPFVSRGKFLRTVFIYGLAPPVVLSAVLTAWMAGSMPGQPLTRGDVLPHALTGLH